jgi:hypothetical protein
MFIIKLCITRFKLNKDLQAIKVELSNESDDSSDSDNSDSDREFRYINDIKGDYLKEDTDDNFNGNENRFRESPPHT